MPLVHATTVRITTALVAMRAIRYYRGAVAPLDRMTNGLFGDVDDHGQPAAAVFLDVVVGRVVQDVTVQEPLAGLACLPDDVVTLAWSDVDGVFLVLGR